MFQCLTHTLKWPAHQWRALDMAHQKRNLAEYEGYLEIEESQITQLCVLVTDLIKNTTKMTEGL